MIKLENLVDDSLRRRRTKLLGRGTGCKRGKTSARGHKGDGSRSGYKRRYGYEGGGVPLYRRVPTRGFSNARFAVEDAEVTTSRLDKVFNNGDVVSLESLKIKKLIKSTVKRVKIILKGELTKTLLWQDSSVLLSQGVLNVVNKESVNSL